MKEYMELWHGVYTWTLRSQIVGVKGAKLKYHVLEGATKGPFSSQKAWGFYKFVTMYENECDWSTLVDWTELLTEQIAFTTRTCYKYIYIHI